MIYVLTRFKREYKVDNFPELIFASPDKTLVERYYQELSLVQEYWEHIYRAYEFTYKMFKEINPEPKPCSDVGLYRKSLEEHLALHQEFHDKFYPELAAQFAAPEEEVRKIHDHLGIKYSIVEVQSDQYV